MRFEQVSKHYARGHASILALRDVSVHISKGEFFALMGPSGSGKSTFLNLVGGLDVASSGEILLDSRSTRTFSDQDWTRMRRHYVGVVFQAFHLLPGLSTEDNVALPLLLNGEASGSVSQRVLECLDMVDMQSRAKHRPSELSGGEQQRVALARALVHRPQLILADEPTGNLDSRHGAEIVRLLRKISQENGQTVILATHSDVAGREADRVIHLRDGQIVS